VEFIANSRRVLSRNGLLGTFFRSKTRLNTVLQNSCNRFTCAWYYVVIGRERDYFLSWR